MLCQVCKFESKKGGAGFEYNEGHCCKLVMLVFCFCSPLSVGNTALTYACCGGYEDVVRILLESAADVEHQNENGHTPLMEAASCGHVGE